MLKNKLIPALLLMICMLLTSCVEHSADKNLLPEKPVIPEQGNYQIVAAEMGVYKKEVFGSASVNYPIFAELTLDSGNALLQEIKVKNNQKVKKGDVLAVFTMDGSAAEQTELQLKLQRKEEEYEQGKAARLAAISAAKANLSALSSHQLEIAKLELEKQEIFYEQYVYQTEREIASIKASLDALMEKQKNNTLVAPFDGIIKSVASHLVGNKVEAREVIISMYSEDGFCLRVSNAGDKLRYGMEVSIEVGRAGGKKRYTGVVVSAPNILSSSTSQADAYILVNESVASEDFQKSITYYADTEYLENVLIVDKAATSMEDGRVYVNILEDDTVKKRYVTQGLASIDICWILDGLKDGQLLIVE